MRRFFTIVGAILLVAVVVAGIAYALGYLPFEPPGTGQEDTASEEFPELDEPIRANQTIIVDARVIPVQKANLSIPTSGIVADVLVQEGEQVTNGQVLVRLDAARQRVDVQRAQAELDRVQAQLDELLAGARPEEIESAQASLDAAMARLRRVVAGADAGDLEAAEAQIAVSQSNLQKVLEGAGDQEVIGARAELQNAEAEVRRAQRAYNEVKWRTDAGALPQAADLERATNNYEAARARLADLEEGASTADISGAQAQVRQSQAQYDSLEATLPADIAAAEAEVRNLESQLVMMQNGARPEEIAAAEANVAAATAALQNALVALSETELKAPFAGTVAALRLEEGEQITAGTPIVQLADLSTYQIETEDLTELQIVDVQVGEEATITFDAIPDLEITGTVERIRPLGEDNRGDIVYTVVLIPAEQDPRLLWNMTAVVTFE